MVIEPGNSINTQTTSAGKARQTVPAKTEGNAERDNSQSDSDNVSLSSASRSIAAIEAKINESSDVDFDKVDQIKAQIASGRYQIDTNAIAEKLLAEETQLS